MTSQSPSTVWARFTAFIENRSRTLIFSLLLIFMFMQNTFFSSLPHAVHGAVLCVLYLAFLWSARSLNSNWLRIWTIAALWGMTVLLGIGFGDYTYSLVLIYYILVFTAVRLPGRVSFIMAALIILVDAGSWLYIHAVPSQEVLVYSLTRVLVFVFIWAIRVRREAKASKALHYEELQEMHMRLEEAHRELQQAHQELEAATVRSLRYAVLEERTRIARDIHDSIGHGLTSVIVQLQALPFIMKASQEEADRTLSTVLEVARGCLTEVRSVVHQMAVDDADLGLVALKSLITEVQEQSGLLIAFDAPETVSEWRPEIAELLYRVLQEALTNVIRHAGATRVEVTLRDNGRYAQMSVKDNGSFRDGTGQLPEGFGIRGMRERCVKEGGSFSAGICEPHGWMIQVEVPLDSPSEDKKGVE
ncbi:sensor histidine kinase [Paenibacillus sp. J22TS3]|uniref:sensor histidine kinase n=1 Tax=Paenibacillus sp. J22TS3 TaxID=2807192 RepID=UPI001BD07AF5|nr:sensor histidine kinase [Paenibacillus sp. J22TS3]